MVMLRTVLVVAVAAGPVWAQAVGAPGPSTPPPPPGVDASTPAAPGENGGEPMSAETARLRMAAALAVETPGLEQLAQLVEVAERAEDAAIAATAAYDAGTLAMGLGDPRASALLAQADRTGTDPAIRARARFNMAHAAMPPDAGEPAADIAAIDARLTGLREAAARFRSVLEVDPGHAEAAANTERVRRMIRDLERQRDEMEQQQQAMEELAEQLERLAEQQEAQAGESQQRAEQGGQGDEEAAREQQAISEQTEAAAEQAARQGDQGGEGGPREELDAARQAQQRAEEALEQGDSEEAAEAQQEAAEALRRAAERAREQAGQDGRQPAEGQPDARQGEGDETAAPGEQPGENGERPGEGEGGVPIDPLAEALLDKERREREQRGQYLQRGRRQQVERDW